MRSAHTLDTTLTQLAQAEHKSADNFSHKHRFINTVLTAIWHACYLKQLRFSLLHQSDSSHKNEKHVYPSS
jgi:hypothetical protein